MNVVDTSAWLAYFAGTQNANKFAVPIQNTAELLVPSICVYEITKVVLREAGEDELLRILAVLQQGSIVDLTPLLATAAAKNSMRYKLPMADSIIYTTARQHKALLWTQDVDFKGLDNVNYLPTQSDTL